jgi:hypothetical protein
MFTSPLLVIPFFLGLLDSWGSKRSGAGVARVILGHNIAIVADNAAGSIPGLIDSNALDGADVQVGLAINTADWLELSVARTMIVDDDLARGFRGDLDNENRVAGGGTFVSIGATIGSANWGRSVLGAVLETQVSLLTVAVSFLNSLGLASSVVGDLLSSASSRAFIVEGIAVSAANGQIDLRTGAGAFGRSRETRAFVGNLGFIALQIAEIVIILAVLAADSGQITDAENALLNGAGFTTTFEGLLDTIAFKFTLIHVIATINATDGLEDEGAFAWSFADVQCFESGIGTSHNAAVFIGNAIGGAHLLLSVCAFAGGIGNGFVVEVVALANLNGGCTIALGSA